MKQGGGRTGRTEKGLFGSYRHMLVSCDLSEEILNHPMAWAG